MSSTATQLRVLNFHGVGTPARPLESGEEDYWIAEDRLCAVLDAIAGHPDRERVRITFDDGNISDIAIALPELQRRGLTAEFFVLTGRIGKPGSLGSEDILALGQAGMRIGSHGLGHRDWTSLAARELTDELQTSKQTLEMICKVPIRSAAMPFGRYNGAVVSALRKAGYAAVYSSDGGMASEAEFLRPRTSIRRDTSDAALTGILAGRLSLVRRFRRAVAMSIKRTI
jgi:peptidoglycan/xylan/chitin deacetylase (PgdA/CDA1 family)